MKSRLKLIKGDKVGSETDYRDALPVNMFAVLKQIFDVPGYMLMMPGLTQYGTGSGIDRGGVWNSRQQRHYRVSGTDLISVDSAGVKTVLGTIPGTDTVSMQEVYSFNTQAVIADGKYVLYDPTNGFRQVTGPLVSTPIDAVWIDGFYVFTDGEDIYHTDVSDEESIEANESTAEFMPDPDLGVGKTQDDKLIVFGRYSTEYFVNSGRATGFIFDRVPSRAVKVGIVGTHCKVEAEDAWFILGGRKKEAVSVHRLGIGSAEKVATREVDKVIGTYTETQLAESVVETYAEDAHTFVVIHLPDDTLQFNVTMAKKAGIDQAWNILKTDVAGDTPWRAIHGVFEPRKGVWVYGSKEDSSIYVLDPLVATHGGDLAEILMFSPFMILESQSIDELEIETIPGFTGADDARVFVSLTYDGVSWSKEVLLDYGGPTKYGKRFFMRRGGDVEDFVGFKFRAASTSRMAFGRATINHG